MRFPKGSTWWKKMDILLVKTYVHILCDMWALLIKTQFVLGICQKIKYGWACSEHKRNNKRPKERHLEWLLGIRQLIQRKYVSSACAFLSSFMERMWENEIRNTLAII